MLKCFTNSQPFGIEPASLFGPASVRQTLKSRRPCSKVPSICVFIRRALSDTNTIVFAALPCAL